jgi:hypothetical protein
MRIDRLKSALGVLAVVAMAQRADSQQISNAADLRAAISSARSGSRVVIPAGTYNIGSTPIRVEGKRNVQIVGAGAGRTIVRASASAPFIIELAGSNDGLTISNMSLEGATRLNTNTHALASGPDRMNLTRARFHDLDIRNTAVGISVVGSGNGYCDDVQITSNNLENIQEVQKADGSTSGSGYGIHNDGCTNVRIAGNTIRNADRHSIYQASAYQPGRPAASGSVVIDGNTIIDHGRTSITNNEWKVALVVARSANVVVSNNTIIDPYHDAISIEDPSEENRNYSVRNVRLVGNTVRNPHAADIFLTASGTFVSEGNQFIHGNEAARPFVRRAGKGVSGKLSGGG